MTNVFSKTISALKYVKTKFANNLLFVGLKYNAPRVVKFSLWLNPDVAGTLISAMNSNLVVAKKLLQIPEIQDQLPADNNYLLRWTVEQNKNEFTSLLLFTNTVHHSLGSNNNYLLHWAVQNAFVSFYIQLVMFHNQVLSTITLDDHDHEKYLALHWQDHKGHLEFFKRMEIIYTYTNHDLEIELANAILNNNLLLVDYLLETKEFDADFYENLLNIAIYRRDFATMQKILPKIDLQSQNKIDSILHHILGITRYSGEISINNQETEIFRLQALQLLMKQDKVLELIKNKPIYYLQAGLLCNGMNLISGLLQHPVFSDAVTNDENEFLHAAIKNNNIEIVKLLLSRTDVINTLRQQSAAFKDSQEESAKIVTIFEDISKSKPMMDLFAKKLSLSRLSGIKLEEFLPNKPGSPITFTFNALQIQLNDTRHVKSQVTEIVSNPIKQQQYAGNKSTL